VPLRLRCDDGVLQLITTLTSFATAVDITLAELHLEAFLPADDATATILHARASAARSDRSRAFPQHLVVSRHHSPVPRE
jgi:hypothetical protein